MKKDTSIPECASFGRPLPRLGRRLGLVRGGRPCGRRAAAAALRSLLTALLSIGTLCVLPGCRLLVGTTAVAVGAVALVGYGVYKTGEVAVTGVGSAVSSAAKGCSSVVFMNGEFKAVCDATVDEVWLASASTLKENGFQSVTGDRDALSGHLEAATWNSQEITIKLEAAGQGQTEFRARIGVAGDLKKSETLYSLITAKLAREREARQQGGA